jgi:hypothetical protein
MIETTTKEGHWTLDDDGHVTHYKDGHRGTAEWMKGFTLHCDCGARLTNRMRTQWDNAWKIVTFKRDLAQKTHLFQQGFGSEEEIEELLGFIRRGGEARDAHCDRRGAVEATRAKF